MQVVKRNKGTGAIVGRFLIAAGKPAVSLAAKPAAIVTVPVKEAKIKATKLERGESQVLRMPKDASDGAKLAFKLNRAIQIEESDARAKAVYALGKLARNIGSGDPDVQAALQSARADQKKAGVQEFVEGDLFERWGTYFIGGYTAKTVQHGVSTPKPYRLTVVVNGEEHRASFERYGQAEHAGVRWWILKSEIGEHHGRIGQGAAMTVTIDTLDLTQLDEEGKHPTVPKLQTVLTYQAAAAKYEIARRHADRGPTTFAPKTAGGTLGFGVKCKNYVATFSGG